MVDANNVGIFPLAAVIFVALNGWSSTFTALAISMYVLWTWPWMCTVNGWLSVSFTCVSHFCSIIYCLPCMTRAVSWIQSLLVQFLWGRCDYFAKIVVLIIRSYPHSCFLNEEYITDAISLLFPQPLDNCLNLPLLNLKKFVIFTA